MDSKTTYRRAAAFGAIAVALLLDACVCRPARIDMVRYTPPASVAELRATLP